MHYLAFIMETPQLRFQKWLEHAPMSERLRNSIRRYLLQDPEHLLHDITLDAFIELPAVGPGQWKELTLIQQNTPKFQSEAGIN